MPVVAAEAVAERMNRRMDQSAEPEELGRCHRTGRRWVLEPAVLADFLLFHLNRQRCLGYAPRYAMPGPADSIEQVLDAIVAARGVLVRSGKQRRADPEAQRQRAAMLMVRDFRKGRLGRLTIDHVPEAVVGRHNTRPAPGRATPRD